MATPLCRIAGALKALNLRLEINASAPVLSDSEYRALPGTRYTYRDPDGQIVQEAIHMDGPIKVVSYWFPLPDGRWCGPSVDISLRGRGPMDAD